MVGKNNHVPHKMIIADHNFCKDNCDEDDRNTFRKDFFQTILPTMAENHLVKEKVILPFCPAILFELVLNKSVIKRYYNLTFLGQEQESFVQLSIIKLSECARDVGLFDRPYHGSQNPMTVNQLADRMCRFKCSEKEDYKEKNRDGGGQNRLERSSKGRSG